MSNALTVTKTIQTWSVKLVKEKPIAYKQRSIRNENAITDLLSFMSDLSEEHFYAVYLNVKMEPIGLSLVSKGTTNASLVHPREVFKGAVLANAHCMIVAHNHPTGNTTPSTEDRETTKVLIKAGELLSIPVVDHVIIGDDTYSFRSNEPRLWA